MGRQPIYGADREIRAYELLYRHAAGDTSARFQDADMASAQVLLRAFLELGLPAVSPEQPVFVNHTRHLLELDPILPPDRCVVEVLEDIAADAEIIAALHRLKSQGYRIALDDFVYSDSLLPMVEMADYIKLDLRGLGRDAFAEHVERLRRFKMPLVAEKIETEEEFRWCRGLGCELFQGYYLRKPEVLSGRRIPANRLSVLSLLAECSNAENSPGTVAATIERDAPLTYSLLRLANSALHQRRTEILSTAQAVVMLGLDFVARWATLLVLSNQNDCPSGYIEASLQRARMAELIAPVMDCEPQDGYIVGLLSALDALFNEPLQALVEPLPLNERFKRALLGRHGALGAMLNAVIAYEAGEWVHADPGPAAGQMYQAFWDAAEYARSMMANMARAASA
ncbi:MAG: EAL domain-containing protein [Candidatus Solibacter sp.]